MLLPHLVGVACRSQRSAPRPLLNNCVPRCWLNGESQRALGFDEGEPVTVSEKLDGVSPLAALSAPISSSVSLLWPDGETIGAATKWTGTVILGTTTRYASAAQVGYEVSDVALRAVGM